MHADWKIEKSGYWSKFADRLKSWKYFSIDGWFDSQSNYDQIYYQIKQWRLENFGQFQVNTNYPCQKNRYQEYDWSPKTIERKSNFMLLKRNTLRQIVSINS